MALALRRFANESIELCTFGERANKVAGDVLGLSALQAEP
jgi:hypothetical protein